MSYFKWLKRTVSFSDFYLTKTKTKEIIWLQKTLTKKPKNTTFLILLLSTTWICSKRHFVTNFLISLRTQRVISSKKASFCSFLFAQEGHLVAIFFYMAILVENGLLFISTHKNVALEFYQQCVDHNFCFSIIPFFTTTVSILNSS